MGVKNFYTVDVLTPHKILAKAAPAVSLLVPTTRGQLNILENHTHIITSLATGILSVFGSSDDPDRHFVVTKGICKVFERNIHILSYIAEESSLIDEDRAKRALENAQRILSSRNTLSSDEIEKYRNKVTRAKLRLQLMGKL